MAKFNKDDMNKAAQEWGHHHEVVAAVRRLLRLTGSKEDAVAAIEGYVLSEQFEKEMKDEE